MVVNFLSLSRIVGALFLPIIFYNINIPSLIILLVFLFVTDFLDGYLARHWSVQTVGGSLLDPLGDKVLAIACILALLEVNKFLIVLLILEFAISILNVYRTTYGEKVKSSMMGKIKTWSLSITLTVCALTLFQENILNLLENMLNSSIEIFVIDENIIYILIYVTCLLQVIAFLLYFIDAIKNKNKCHKKTFKLVNLKIMIKRLFDENRYEKDMNKPLLEILKL